MLFCPSLALLLLPIPPLSAAEIHVDDTSGLSAAMDSAGPGDEIILAAGTYTISDPLYPATAGTEEEPIIVRAEEPGAAILETNTAMAFEVRVPHWTFEGRDIQGVCVNHTNCEHAFHIIYQADHTVVRNCVMRDFNAQIKGNGESNGVEMIFPDDVLIEGSELYNESIRATVNPVTPIDVVGGQRWTVRSNFIHDFAKGLSDSVSYAAFYKGNSADGVFERNLVVCEQLHSGGTRVGLSFGGGGSYPDSICEDSDCSTEHSRGIIRNNIVADCSDVGIYLNESSDTGVYNNTLYNTAGLDVRFATSSADIRNNILSETINLRDGGEVRVDAPAFAAGKEEPSWGTASFAALAAMAQAEESGEAPRIVVPQGTFTIVTDGRILANNTDEGPKPHARGQSLRWNVGPSTQQPPTALVAFD